MGAGDFPECQGAHGIRLVSIPESEYSDYRYGAIFKAYKWDPQFGDRSTVSKKVVLLNSKTAHRLAAQAEALAQETMAVEEALPARPELVRKLGLPRSIRRAAEQISEYDRQIHVRLMRFDFHPTQEGWAISEVNSDVPGGLAESSVLPRMAARYFDGFVPFRSSTEALAEAFLKKVPVGGRIVFVHCTSYSDDRQVMECLSDCFREKGYRTVFAAPDHLRWENGYARLILEGEEGSVDGIVRFFPLEWMAELPRNCKWQGFFGSRTVSCNHPIAIFAQSKRLPLVWDSLGVEIPAWRELLPETENPRRFGTLPEGSIYKPALGRVGERISIREAISPKEYRKIERSARMYPKDWIVQKRFQSLPIQADTGELYHMCLGVFTVEEKFAGFYARVSPSLRIDASAEETPVLVGNNGRGVLDV